VAPSFANGGNLFVLPKFGFGKVNASSSVVESEFSDIKYRLLKYNSQSMRIDKFLTLHIQSFSGKAKLAISEINRPVLSTSILLFNKIRGVDR